MSEPYTDADVQLVVDAMAEAVCTCPPGSRCASHEVDAEVALAALAGAGRLTPAGSTREIEYALTAPGVNGSVWHSEPYYRRDVAESHRTGPETVVQRTILAGPWVEADEDGTG